MFYAVALNNTLKLLLLKNAGGPHLACTIYGRSPGKMWKQMEFLCVLMLWSNLLPVFPCAFLDGNIESSWMLPCFPSPLPDRSSNPMDLLLLLLFVICLLNSPLTLFIHCCHLPSLIILSPVSCLLWSLVMSVAVHLWTTLPSFHRIPCVICSVYPTPFKFLFSDTPFLPKADPAITSVFLFFLFTNINLVGCSPEYPSHVLGHAHSCLSLLWCTLYSVCKCVLCLLWSIAYLWLKVQFAFFLFCQVLLDDSRPVLIFPFQNLHDGDYSMPWKWTLRLPFFLYYSSFPMDLCF